jgi:hypothetical protein
VNGEVAAPLSPSQVIRALKRPRWMGAATLKVREGPPYSDPP